VGWRAAEARVVTGDPFVEPLALAGTWHYLDEDVSPAEAAAARLLRAEHCERWHRSIGGIARSAGTVVVADRVDRMMTGQAAVRRPFPA